MLAEVTHQVCANRFTSSSLVLNFVGGLTQILFQRANEKQIRPTNTPQFSGQMYVIIF